MYDGDEENIHPEVFQAARAATLDLLPQKSRQQYELWLRGYIKNLGSVVVRALASR